MGTAIKIAVSFLAHMRAEIGAFKVKGRDFLGSNPLLPFIPLGQGRKGRAGNFTASIFVLLTCYLSEKLPSAPFITCLSPAHAPTSLHPSWWPTVHKLLSSLSAGVFSLCLHLHSLIFIRTHRLYFFPWEAPGVLYDSGYQRDPGPAALEPPGSSLEMEMIAISLPTPTPTRPSESEPATWAISSPPGDSKAC